MNTIYTIPEQYYNSYTVFNLIGMRLFPDTWGRQETTVGNIIGYEDKALPEIKVLAKNLLYYYEKTEGLLKERYKEDNIDNILDKAVDTSHPLYTISRQIWDIRLLGLTQKNIESEEYSLEFLRYYRKEYTAHKLYKLCDDGWLKKYGKEDSRRYSRNEVDNLLNNLFSNSPEDRIRYFVRDWLKPQMLAGEPPCTQQKMYKNIFTRWFEKEYSNI